MIDTRAAARALMLAVVALIFVAPQKSAAADALLAEKRWSEHSYGVSFQPPLGSHISERGSSDDAIVRIAGEGNYFIKLYIKTRETKKPTVMSFDYDKRKNIKPGDKINDNSSPVENAEVLMPEKGPLTLKEVMDRAIDEIANVRPSARILLKEKEEPKTLNDKPQTQVIYFRIPDPKRGYWILGKAIALLNDSAVAIFELEVDEAQFEHARPIFEAVAASLQADDPVKLRKQRDAMLQAGARWRQAVTPRVLHERLVPEQWVKIVDNGKEVGYIQTKQMISREMSLPGVRIDVLAHLVIADQSMDSQANFFASDDGENEIWSIRTTTRPAKEAPGQKESPLTVKTYAETGVRAGAVITITQEGPSGQKEYKWDRPTVQTKPETGPNGQPILNLPPPTPLPYASQAELQMLDTIVPHNAPLDIGFYAYNSGTGKLSLRSERVVPQPDGRSTVYSRLAPELPELVTIYAADGRMIQRTLPNGQLMLPASKAELKAKVGAK